MTLHPDVSSEILINVARSIEEAKLQQKGKEFNNSNLLETDEEKVEIKNMFEDEKMAEKISNQNEESNNEEISSDSKKQTLNGDPAKVSSDNSTTDESKVSKEQK